MLKGGQIPIRDRYQNRVIRPGQACQRIVLEILQMYFEGVKDEKGKPLWCEDIESTRIFIGDNFSNGLDIAAIKPAIIVKRGPARFTKRGGIGSKVGRDMMTGTVQYHDLISGSAVIMVVFTNPEIADNFANDIFEVFGYIKDMPRQKGFFSINPPLLGEVGNINPIESRPKLAAVPITIDGEFAVRWDVTELAAKLEKYTVLKQCAV